MDRLGSVGEEKADFGSRPTTWLLASVSGAGTAERCLIHESPGRRIDEVDWESDTSREASSKEVSVKCV